MRSLRIDGKPDEERLNQTVKILFELGIPKKEILQDYFLLLHRNSYKTMVKKNVQGSPGEINKEWIIHRPDIVIWRDNTHKCVIEVDGSIHDTSRGKRKTEKRNNDYWFYKVPHITLNEADLDFLGVSWYDFLWTSLMKMDLI